MLVASPWVFGYADDDGGLRSVCVAAGLALLILSLVTEYEGGMIGLVPLHAHLMIDVAIGFILALSPWMSDVTGRGAAAWLPALMVGGAVLVTALATRDGRARASRPPRGAP